MTIVESHNRIFDAALFECDPERRKQLAHQYTDELLAITEPFWKFLCPSQLPKEDSGQSTQQRDAPAIIPESSGTKGD